METTADGTVIIHTGLRVAPAALAEIQRLATEHRALQDEMVFRYGEERGGGEIVGTAPMKYGIALAALTAEMDAAVKKAVRATGFGTRGQLLLRYADVHEQTGDIDLLMGPVHFYN